VLNIIQSSDLIDELADHIAGLGDGWVTKSPVFDVDGKTPLLDQQGKQLIQQDPSDETMEVGEQVVRVILNMVHNEKALQGANWHPTTGRTSEAAPSLDGRDPDEAIAENEETGFSVKATYGPGSVLHGVYIDDVHVSNPVKREVHMEVRNVWLRYLCAYAEY